MVDYYRVVMGAEGSRHGRAWRRAFLWKCIASAVRIGLAQRIRHAGRGRDHRAAYGVATRTDRSSGVPSSAHWRRSGAAAKRGLMEKGTEAMTTWVQEVRHAVRALLTRPGFTAIVVLTLALGIGANTAVFSVLHAVLLTPLPYKDAEQLVRVYGTRRDNPASLSVLTAPAVRDLQETLTTTSSFAALNNYQQMTADLTDGRPERVTVLPVSEGYFDVVGEAPVIGRTFRREEFGSFRIDELGAAAVAVISYRVFTSYFGGAAGVLPSTLTVDGVQYTVVGVMPEAYEDPLQGRIDVFLPISGLYSNQSWGNYYLTAIARLRPGATVRQLNAELEAVAERHREPSGDEGLAYVAVPLSDDLVGSADTTLWLIMGAVALVFLIACVNVASVTLARGAARQKELAIRVALGSGRGRLIRQLLTESALLGVLGGLVGLGLGAGVVRGLVSLAPAELPGLGEATLEGPVFLFGLGASVAAVLLFGLLPALRASRTSVDAALRQGGRSGGEGGPDRSRLRSALVVAEVSLALVLLVGAGILVRSFQRLTAVDLVVEPRNVAVFYVGTPGARYDAEARARFHQEYLARLSALPGVEAAGAVSWLPIGGNYHVWGTRRVVGTDPSSEFTATNQRIIEGDYFDAVGIDVVRGRTFGSQDHADDPDLLVVNRRAVEALFPDGADPIGAVLDVVGEQKEIIGVVEDVPIDARGELRPMLYHLHRQFAADRNWSLRYTVKLAQPEAGFLNRARAVLAALDPNLVLYQPALLTDILNEKRAAERFAMILLAAFAAVALLLTAVGIYGILAQSVNRRRHEIGIRVALGARGQDVVAMVVRQGIGLAAVGIIIGLAGAFIGARLLASMVFEVSIRDPVVFSVVPIGVLIVALAASWIPAARATRVDPAEAFRAD